MSVPKRALIIAPVAQKDIADVLLYTQRTWGRSQRTKYRATLYGEFDQLARFPFKGRARPDISSGLRSIPIDQHVIYYRVDEDSVTIRRIVHNKQDIAGEAEL